MKILKIVDRIGANTRQVISLKLFDNYVTITDAVTKDDVVTVDTVILPKKEALKMCETISNHFE